MKLEGANSQYAAFWTPMMFCAGQGGPWGKRTNIPALALLVVGELLLDHADDDLVADEAALVHDLLGLNTEGGLLGNLRAQHVTGGLRIGNEGLAWWVWAI